MPLCEQLKTEYAQLEELKKEFDGAFEEAVKTGKTEKAMALKKEMEERLKNLKEKLVPKEIQASYLNPETNEKKEIKLNLKEQVQSWQEFYQKHNLPALNEQELRKIFQKNHKEMKEEMERYGYDHLLIIPENLPETEALQQKMSEGYTETWQSDNFKEGGSFAGAKHAEKNQTRIILCHNDQDIYANPKANPLAKQTLNKNILQLSGLTEAEIQQKIQNQESLPIDFEAEINGKTIPIQAEGLSLNEYLLFQRQYFEKNQKHLDEKGWTWLLKSFSASRVVSASWGPDFTQLFVDAYDPGVSDGDLGCRLSRSFSS